MPIHITTLQDRLTARRMTGVDDIHLREKRWFAVRTCARHEKKAAARLKDLGIEVYVPLRERMSHYPSKSVLRRVALLPGYVFVRITQSEERAVLRCAYTRGFVRLGPDRRQVTDREIKLLRLLSTDRTLTWQTAEVEFDLSEGTPVEIISGPLAGVKGSYSHKKSKKSFVISLAGGGALFATCEVDPLLLAPINGATEPGKGSRAPQT